MFLRSCAAGSDNRNRHIFRNQRCEFIIVTSFSSITVHAGKQDLAGSQGICLHGPLDRIQTGVNAPAVLVYIPAGAIFPASRINGHDYALTAKLICCVADQLRRIDGGRIDGNLIRALAEKAPEILHGTDASAHGKRDKHGFCHPAYHVHHSLSRIGRCRNIQKYQFIGTSLIICCSNLHRITCIPQIYKINTFYYPAIVNIQAGNDSLCKHMLLQTALSTTG